MTLVRVMELGIRRMVIPAARVFKAAVQLICSGDAEFMEHLSERKYPIYGTPDFQLPLLEASLSVLL